MDRSELFELTRKLDEVENQIDVLGRRAASQAKMTAVQREGLLLRLAEAKKKRTQLRRALKRAKRRKR